MDTKGKNKKSKLYKIALILLAIVFIAALSIFVYNKIEEQKYKDDIDEYQEEIDNQEEHHRVNPINFEKLQGKNSEIYAWISIPQIDISYPVLQNEKDNFYLRKNIYKEYSRIGSIYTNSVNSTDFTDFNTVIYGHNVTDKAGNMFSPLHDLKNQEDFDRVKNVYIYTPEKMYTYEIEMVVRYYPPVYIPDEFPQVSDADKERFLSEMKKATANREGKLREDVEMTIEDKYITLSTCMLPKDTRLLVIAKLIDEYEWK